MATVEKSELTGELLDDKYLIDRRLGKGGMGSVYLATHVGTDRPVALKVIAPQFMLEEEFVERFRREAKAAGRLYHPNVVNVTDFGFARVGSESVAYLVMEYLEGCTLAEILAEETQIPIEWVLDILEQTCSAVDQAHRLGIIHRDLKPDNIWLVPNRRGGYTVKVLDFGLAKLADHASASAPSASGEPSSSTSLLSGRQASYQIGLSPLKPGASSTVDEADALEAITPVHPTSLSEARTQIQPPVTLQEPARSRSDSDPEAATQLLQATSNEAATQLQQARTTAGEELAVHGGKTVGEGSAALTAAADGLTRMGSILGTPLYMSPEQCQSQPLDPRADIYSLGVIAYQMLAGQPPFTGQIHEVMKQHVEASVPSLRDKRHDIPKKMAKLVMSALSKDPGGRPARAEAFASAMRASAEGTGQLFRRALSLYTEHFPKFFRVSLLFNLPIIVLACLEFGADILNIRGVIPPTSARVARGVMSILMVGINFLAASVISGVTIRMVTQVFLAPLRLLELRVAFAALKKRLGALLFTTFLSGLLVVVGSILCVLPGLWMFINYALSAPVVMMENLKGRAALKRSTALVSRSRGTVIAVAIIQWAIPAVATGIAGALFGGLFKASGVAHAPQLTGGVIGIVSAVLNVFFIPLLSTMSALLYLKTRQIGGETLEEALGQFELEDVPRTRWQQRMRERLYSSTPSA